MFEKFRAQKIEPIESKTQKEIKKSGFEYVQEKANKFIKRLRQATFVLGIIVAANYYETHSTDIEKDYENGKEVFKHPDKETNHILNYLAGADSLTRQEQINTVKDGIAVSLKEEGINLPDNYFSMSEEEFLSYLESINDKVKLVGPESKTTLKEDINKTIDENLPTKYEYNDTLYNILWKVEKECGAPKIRWTVGDERNMFLMNTSAVAHYNPVTHTIFIHPGDYQKKHVQIKELISELPHSKQLYDNYFSSIAGGIEAATRIAKEFIKNRSIVGAQLKEYDVTGSIENEAHNIIEPELKKEFKDIKSINLEDE